MKTDLHELINFLAALDIKEKELAHAQDRARIITTPWFADEIKIGNNYLNFCLDKLEELAIENFKKGVVK